MKNRETISNNKSGKLKNSVLVSLFSAIIAVCSLIAIPLGSVPLTMQTLGIFCALLLLGGKRGTLSILLYIFIGIVGLPVFSGFGGGIGHLLNITGGYIVGFIFTGLVYCVFTKIFGEKTLSKAVALALGLAVCYLFGTLWYALMYTDIGFISGLKQAFAVCVLPFIIPDTVKLFLSVALCKAVIRRFPQGNSSL